MIVFHLHLAIVPLRSTSLTLFYESYLILALQNNHTSVPGGKCSHSNVTNHWQSKSPLPYIPSEIHFSHTLPSFFLQTGLAYSRTWHHISLVAASTPSLGRLASQIAILLMGKHKPIWDPSTDCGDYVVATGCTDVYATGRKMQQKLYYRQTTKPGALKAINMETMVRKWGGGEVLKRAVRGMLPKNRLREPRLARLKGEFCFGREVLFFLGGRFCERVGGSDTGKSWGCLK